jgi:hypothetical protein
MATSQDSVSSNTTEECSICLGSLSQQGKDTYTTACQHTFHFQCLAKHVQAQNSECPLCRTRLDSLVDVINTSSNNSMPSPPIQNVPIQQPVAPPENNTGVWGTLTKSLSSAFGWISGRSNQSASTANPTNRRSTWSVS